MTSVRFRRYAQWWVAALRDTLHACCVPIFVEENQSLFKRVIDDDLIVVGQVWVHLFIRVIWTAKQVYWVWGCQRLAAELIATICHQPELQNMLWAWHVSLIEQDASILCVFSLPEEILLPAEAVILDRQHELIDWQTGPWLLHDKLKLILETILRHVLSLKNLSLAITSVLESVDSLLIIDDKNVLKILWICLNDKESRRVAVKYLLNLQLLLLKIAIADLDLDYLLFGRCLNQTVDAWWVFHSSDGMTWWYDNTFRIEDRVDSIRGPQRDWPQRVFKLHGQYALYVLILVTY